jgi:hypothetical protein
MIAAMSTVRLWRDADGEGQFTSLETLAGRVAKSELP